MSDNETNGPERQLKIHEPCPMKWSALEPVVGEGERQRYCGKCELHVHNAAELTRDEAEALAQEARATQARLCMRIVTDESGAPLHRKSCGAASTDSVAPVAASRAPLGRTARRFLQGAIAAGATLLAACRGDATVPAPADPLGGGAGGGHPETMMGVVCPEPPEGMVGEAEFVPEEGGECAPGAEGGETGAEAHTAALGRVALEVLGDVALPAPPMSEPEVPPVDPDSLEPGTRDKPPGDTD